MSRRVEIRDSTDRYVLFLEAPTETYRQQFDGQVQQRVDQQLEKFLTESSPEAGLKDKDKFPHPVRQLKDRGSNLRAFGIWCQGSDYDLFIIQKFYDRENDDPVMQRKYIFAEEGENYQQKFSDLEHDEIVAKVDEWRDREDLLVKTPPGCP
jgi:hypothetical protein